MYSRSENAPRWPGCPRIEFDGSERIGQSNVDSSIPLRGLPVDESRAMSVLTVSFRPSKRMRIGTLGVLRKSLRFEGPTQSVGKKSWFPVTYRWLFRKLPVGHLQQSPRNAKHLYGLLPFCSDYIVRYLYRQSHIPERIRFDFIPHSPTCHGAVGIPHSHYALTVHRFIIILL